jgi:competence protein ComEC
LLAIATLLLWAGALLDNGSSRLVVSVLDVGQGDAILIETPAGHRILVDGGPSGARLSQVLGRARRFDLVVLTHGQDDHVTGLVSLFDRYEVGAVLKSPLAGNSGAYNAWVDATALSSIPVHEAVAGEYVDLGDGIRLEVLGPPPGLLHDTEDDLNNNSVVLRLVYGDVSFLLTGDIEADAEATLLQQGGALRSTVLKVAHHGSDGSSTPAFLAAVKPAVAVISTGVENSFGHPSPTTRLRLAGVPLLRTDLNGRVRFETDGRRLWAGIERGEVELLSPEVGASSPGR